MKKFDLGAVTAYAVAVKNGFEGTETEWIASLKGEKGDKFIYEDFTAEQLADLVGPKGDKGDKGEPNVVANWEQNDETQPDYIKNRPFHGSVTEAPLDIQWDGTLDGKELIEIEPGAGYGLVKLSDAVLTEEQLKSCTFGFAGEDTEGTYQEVPLSEDGVLQADPAMGMIAFMPYIWEIYDPSAMNAAAAADGVNLNLTAGVYTLYQAGMVTDWHLWSDTVTVKTDNIVHLPSKYLSFVDVTEEKVAVMDEQTVVVEEQSSGNTFDKNLAGVLPIKLTKGKTYTIVWDGVEHTLADTWEALNEVNSAAGFMFETYWSPVVDGLENELGEGEFALCNISPDFSPDIPAEALAVTYVYGCPTEAGEHTIAIYDEVPKTKETVKIKKEALPDGVGESPIYTEAVAAEIIPEQEVKDTGYGVEVTNWVQKPLSAGYAYTVVFDGATYSCISTTNDIMSALYGGEVTLIGNGALHPYYSIAGLPDSGEPFLIMAVEYKSDVFVLTSTKNTAFTIQASGYYANHHLLPYKYMRKPVTISAALESIPELSGDEKSAAVAELYEAEEALKNGLDVFATYDGETVQLTYISINQWDSIYTYKAITKNGWQTATIQTSGVGRSFSEVSNALSAGYSKSIVLQSSTEGSTKKFKVTIDDDGVLTPTEIT